MLLNILFSTGALLFCLWLMEKVHRYCLSFLIQINTFPSKACRGIISHRFLAKHQPDYKVSHGENSELGYKMSRGKEGYEIIVAYTYTMNGVNYRSEVFSYPETEIFGSKEEAEKNLELYTKGYQAVVYASTNNNSLSYIKPFSESYKRQYLFFNITYTIVMSILFLAYASLLY